MLPSTPKISYFPDPIKPFFPLFFFQFCFSCSGVCDALEKPQICAGFKPLFLSLQRKSSQLLRLHFQGREEGERKFSIHWGIIPVQKPPFPTNGAIPRLTSSQGRRDKTSRIQYFTKQHSVMPRSSSSSKGFHFRKKPGSPGGDLPGGVGAPAHREEQEEGWDFCRKGSSAQLRGGLRFSPRAVHQRSSGSYTTSPNSFPPRYAALPKAQLPS